MSAFEPITLEWDGLPYVIPADKVMGAIGRIEAVITMSEIHTMAAKGGAFQLVRIASAYAAALKYAGADVTAEDVYTGMFASGMAGQELIMASVSGLLSMMIPPSKLTSGIPSGNRKPVNSKSSPSSKPRTKRPSRAGA